jgi:hypothetical protein
MLDGLRGYGEVWAVDFEFIAQPGERPEVVCLSAQEWRTGKQLLLLRDQLGDDPPYDVSPDSLFVAYYAGAELGCHRTLGWRQPARILDLYCEFRNHRNGLGTATGKWGLIDALAFFDLSSIEVTEKESMRELILRGGPWSAEEQQAILAYCQTDTDALVRLLPRLLPHIDLPRALLRGRYVSALSAIEHRGTPIDVEKLEILRERWDAIQDRLIRAVDYQYGVYEGRSFREDRFEIYLSNKGVAWPRLDSGRLALDSDTFKDMAKICPAILDLANLRSSLGQMRLNDLAVGRDGFNRCLLSAFASRTGRNQPSNTKYIFGPSTWLRSLIQPKKGYGICYIDWTQQEFGIAAALSNDPNMMSAYFTGDSYLAFAKMAGAVPANATKRTHKVIRENYKQCVLGKQYGMEEESLSKRINAPRIVARDLIRQHHEVFRQYWAWSDNAVDRSILEGEQQTVFGWTHHIPQNFNPRTVRNFFMQANGAEMLRIACILGVDAGIEICATLHDAILIQAPLDRLAADVTRMRECMAEASAIVLDGFRLNTGDLDAETGEFTVDLIRYPDRYSDERGVKFWALVWESFAKHSNAYQSGHRSINLYRRSTDCLPSR